jgi:hypothetical protein
MVFPLKQKLTGNRLDRWLGREVYNQKKPFSDLLIAKKKIKNAQRNSEIMLIDNDNSWTENQHIHSFESLYDRDLINTIRSKFETVISEKEEYVYAIGEKPYQLGINTLDNEKNHSILPRNCQR